MKATVTFTGLDVWQMGRLIRAAERAGGLPEPRVDLADVVDLVLVDNGANRIQVIKAIRDVTGLGIKEAKDLTEALPAIVLARMPVAKMGGMRARFGDAGATIEFRDVSGKAGG